MGECTARRAELIGLDLGQHLVGVQPNATEYRVHGLRCLAALILIAREPLLQDAGRGRVVDAESDLALLSARLGEVGGDAGLERLGEDALGDLVGIVKGIGVAPVYNWSVHRVTPADRGVINSPATIASQHTGRERSQQP